MLSGAAVLRWLATRRLPRSYVPYVLFFLLAIPLLLVVRYVGRFYSSGEFVRYHMEMTPDFMFDGKYRRFFNVLWHWGLGTRQVQESRLHLRGTLPNQTPFVSSETSGFAYTQKYNRETRRTTRLVTPRRQPSFFYSCSIL